MAKTSLSGFLITRRGRYTRSGYYYVLVGILFNLLSRLSIYASLDLVKGLLGLAYDDTRIGAWGNKAFWKNGHMGFLLLYLRCEYVLVWELRASARDMEHDVINVMYWGGQGK